MFKRILIANRGEIACRIIRTARRLGIATVAVYSDADRDAPHTAMADEAIPIGPPPVSESYLCIDKLAAACVRAGADAVHPGYGFLSERADFAEALAKAGVVFIGPNPAAIAAMGDKIAAKKLAAKARVSTVPGHLGAIANEREAVRIAAEIGYPVMIKAAAGGGGKGMRVAATEAEVAEGYARAQSEARSAFGDARVFIEKYIERPRHIEIQVLGDKHGNVVHLGERECSIQRRNQKIVEETPSPLIDAKTRAKMGAQAVELTKAVGYDSAGTVEFVVTQDKKFYFLEMNTRLQVEHPVTELATGIDLVEQMIRIAAGEAIPFTQNDIALRGWAVETRIYAEDPSRNFLPSIGRLTRFRPPPVGAGLQPAPTDRTTVRIDTGVEEGSEISIYYDPLIAKLITHAPSRREAVAAQADALDAFTIQGIRHNIPFLSALMGNARWQAGELSTGFIADEYPEGFRPLSPSGQVGRVLAAVAAAIDYVVTDRRRRISGQTPTLPSPASAGGSGWGVQRDGYRVVRLGPNEVTLEIERNDEAMVVRFAGEPGRPTHSLIACWRPGDPLWTGGYDGRAVAVQVRPVLNGFEFSHRGVEARAYVYSREQAAIARLMPARASADAGKVVRCPMPGVVVSIAVAARQEVKAGEALAVVEAMKMENVLRAERDGVVKNIKAKPGDSLAVDDIILEFA